MANGNREPFEGGLLSRTPNMPPDPDFTEDQMRVVNLLDRLSSLKTHGARVQVPGVTGFEEGIETARQTAGALGDAGMGGPAEMAELGLRGIGGLVQGVRGMMEELGIDLGGEEVETEGPGGRPPSPDAEPLDITDPRIEVDEKTWNSMGPSLRRLRIMRRVLETTRMATFFPTELAEGDPITRQGRQAEGTLAPPINMSEAAGGFIGENLLGGVIPGLGIYKPIQLGTKAALTSTRLGTQISQRVAQRLGQNPGRVSRMLLGPGGREASEQAILESASQRVPGLMSAAAGEGAAGSILSGGFVAREQTETGQEIDPWLTAAVALGGGIFGGVLGMAGRVGDIRDIGRAARLFDDLARQGDVQLPVGSVVGGKKLNLRSDGQRVWRDAETGQFTSPPEPEDLQNQLVKQVAQARTIQQRQRMAEELAEIEQKPQGEMTPEDIDRKRILEQELRRDLSDEDMAASVDAEIQRRIREEITDSPEKVRETMARAAEMSGAQLPDETREFFLDATQIWADYENTAARFLPGGSSEMEPRVYERTMDQLRLLANDPSIDETTRKTALGRAMAMESALKRHRGEEPPIQMPGGTPVGVEKSAKKMARMADDAEFERAMNSLEASGAEGDPRAGMIAQRARRLREVGAPERAHSKVEEMLAGRNTMENRGLTEGSDIILPDGTKGRIADEPEFGFAHVKRPGNETLELVDLRNARPSPKAGQYVELTGGQVGKVVNVDGEAGRVGIKRPNQDDVTLVGLDELERVGSAPEIKTSLKARFAAEGGRADQETLQNAIPPVREMSGVLRDTGERVKIIGTTGDRAVVQYKDGSIDAVDINVMAPGSKSAPDPQVGGPREQLTTFEPGTTPAEGRHINYLVLDETRAAKFDAALEAGQSVGQALETVGNPSLHLFPQPPRGSTRLYAVELGPEGRTLTDASKKALGVLSENVGVGEMNPQTLQARVRVDPSEMDAEAVAYRVPDGLRQRVRSPFAAFNDMEEDQVLDYLRRLTDLGFEVDSRQARAATASREATEAASEARARGDHGEAELLETQAHLEASRAGEETVAAKRRVLERLAEGMEEDLVQRMSEEDNLILEMLREGDPDGIKAYLAKLEPSGPDDLPSHQLVLSHPDNPGYRILVSKRSIRSFERGAPERTVEEIDELIGESLGGVENLTPENLVQLAGGVRAAQRDIFLVEYVAPDGSPIHTRTIGTEGTVRVPEAMTVEREGLGHVLTPQSRAQLREAVDSGENMSMVLRRLREEAQPDQYVKLEGRGDTEFRIIEEPNEDGVMVLEGPEGASDRFQMQASEVIGEVEAKPPKLAEVDFPRRLQPDEVLEEVYGEMRRWNVESVASYNTGEWRHPVPRYYASLRAHPRREGWIVRTFREKENLADYRNKAADEVAIEEFATREEAVEFLESYGFMEPREAGSQLVENFAGLPEVQAMSQTEMIQMESIIEDALTRYMATRSGYIPGPLRTYALEFAHRWRQLGLQKFTSLNHEHHLNWPFSGQTRERIGLILAGDRRPDLGFRSSLERASSPRGPSPGSPRTVQRSAGPGSETMARLSRGQKSPEHMYTDTKLVDGIVLDAVDHPVDPNRAQAAREIFETMENLGRFYDMDPAPDVRPDDMVLERLVRYGADRRLAVVTDPKHGEPDVTLMVPEGKTVKFLDVAKSDVARVRDPEMAHNFKSMVQDNMNETRLAPRTRPRGFGEVDKKLGLGGVDDPERYETLFRDGVQDILDRVHMGDDGHISASPEDQDALIEAWIRSKEMGIDLDKVRLERVLDGDGNVVDTRRLGTQVPEPLAKALDRLAWEELSNVWGPKSPFGDLVARAKLGMLNSKELDTLAEQAKSFGIEDMEPYQQVEYLVENVWDPITAHRLYEMRNDLGFMRFATEQNDNIPGAVTFRSPNGARNVDVADWSGRFHLPRTLAKRHPTYGQFFEGLQKLVIDEGIELRTQRALFAKLRSGKDGYSLEEAKELRRLMQDERLLEVKDHPDDIPAWGEVKEAIPELDDKFEFGYRVLSEFFREKREELIEVSLRRGNRVRSLKEIHDDSPVEARRVAMKEFNLTKDEWANQIDLDDMENIFVIDPNAKGSDAVPKAEAREFIHLLRDYASWDDIPQNLRDNTPDWIKPAVFNQWKNYGIRNYWPMVHQGKFVIEEVTEEGANQIRGFAKNGDQALNIIRRWKDEGTFGPDTDFEIRVKGHNVDDITAQYLGTSEAKRKWAHIHKIATMTSDQVNEIFETLGVRSAPKRGVPVHAKRREGNLAPVIEDPIRELQIYGARVARSRYLMDVQDAWERSVRLDNELSEAYGIPSIFKSTREGAPDENTFNLPGLGQELKALKADALGERGQMETWMDSFTSQIERIASWPKRKVDQFIRKINDDPDYDLYNDPDFIDAIFDADYATRQKAQEAVALQSLLRLGINVGASAVNSTQFFVAAVPQALRRGGSLDDVMGGLSDFMKYVQHATPETLDSPGSILGKMDLPDWAQASIKNPLKVEGVEGGQELADFAAALGLTVQPSKGTSGFLTDVLSSEKPIIFADQNMLEAGFDWFRYYAMMPFNKAERFNRLSTAFTARRIAKNQGLSEDAAVNFARKFISETQFDYYDLALPRAMRGPLARVLFQFKPFMVNFLKFQKDMMLDSLPMRVQTRFRSGNRGHQISSKQVRDARKALAAWAGITSAVGGSVVWADHPLLHLPWQLAAQVEGIPGPEAMLAGGGRERYAAADTDKYWDHPMFRAQDVVKYGLPGLLGINIGHRVSVGGQDVDPRRWEDMLLGPHYSMYWEFMKGLNEYRQQKGGAGLATMFGAAGSEAVRQGLSTRFPILRRPGVPLATLTAGIDLASRVGQNEFRDFLRDEYAGRSFINEIQPTLLRGVNFTYDMFRNDGKHYSPSYMLEDIPPGPTRLHESAAATLGFQTARSAETNAYMSFIRNRGMAEEATRRSFIRRMARAWLDGDHEKLARLQEQSVQTLIDPITQDDFIDAAARLETPAVEKLIEDQLMNIRPRLDPSIEED